MKTHIDTISPLPKLELCFFENFNRISFKANIFIQVSVEARYRLKTLCQKYFNVVTLHESTFHQNMLYRRNFAPDSKAAVHLLQMALHVLNEIIYNL